ncbi:Protein-lysine N-methyltransferase n6amt2 [Armadillidium nasatum]|uniref:Protein-lysine N-methyltransferase Anas_05048 n=1 Tax=Armadillidium nasatum TaxID=96803 RepID=A0A5N5SXS8_9CRUS|nr:Protein-lysine N-methyltransferase n6amt2 [Armadillidium nasatum]
MSDTETNDDPPQLSAETMKALLEFYEEQEEREQKLQEISEDRVPDTFEENWNMSQFWYSEETADALAKECLRVIEDEGKIACISCPTLYRSIKKLKEDSYCNIFEYDTRFAVFKEEFIFYDFKAPLDVPRQLRGEFSVLIADPPYLSNDCLTKTAITIKFLAKPDAKIILCTGSIMEELADRLLKLKRCKYPIKHNKRLSNPFVCYANYDLDLTCKEK